MMPVFISPHNDDETLFGAFTILREKPLVVVVYDSYVQAARGNPVTCEQRREESRRACMILGVSLHFLEFPDSDPGVTAEAIRDRMRGVLRRFDGPIPIFAPAHEVNGHPQHNLVAAAVDGDPRVVRYLTYTTAGKSVSKQAVPILEPGWIGKKLRALACYESQWAPRLGCSPHFLRDQTEYYL